MSYGDKELGPGIVVRTRGHQLQYIPSPFTENNTGIRTQEAFYCLDAEGYLIGIVRRKK